MESFGLVDVAYLVRRSPAGTFQSCFVHQFTQVGFSVGGVILGGPGINAGIVYVHHIKVESILEHAVIFLQA